MGFAEVCASAFGREQHEIHDSAFAWKVQVQRGRKIPLNSPSLCHGFGYKDWYLARTSHQSQAVAWSIMDPPSVTVWAKCWICHGLRWKSWTSYTRFSPRRHQISYPRMSMSMRTMVSQGPFAEERPLKQGTRVYPKTTLTS